MRRHLPTVIVAAALLGILALAVTFAVSAWLRSSAQISTHGWIALGLGVFFSIVIGCGLMALLFYSARHGYDDAARSIDDRELP